MKKIKITTSKKELKEQLKGTGINYSQLPKKGQIVKMENAQKTLITGGFRRWEKGQSKSFWRMKRYSLNILSSGTMYIGETY